MEITFKLNSVSELSELRDWLNLHVAPANDLITQCGDFGNAPIADLQLSLRAVNCLKSENIQTIGQLVIRSKNGLSKVPNLGAVCLRQIESALKCRGLELAHYPKATFEKAES